MQKNQYLRKLLLSAVCFAFILNAQAQSNLISRAFAVISIGQSNQSSGEFTVLLEDTTNVSEIRVMIGSEADSSNLVLYTFSYDVNTSLPSGFTYSRSQNMVTLAVGTFATHSTYFGSVKIKDNTNSWRPDYNFITN
jgi:hypothetical protein